MGSVTMPEQHVPPQNIEAEESVLGAMLVSDRALKGVRVDSGLTPQHFYLDKHREIFAAICRVAERTGTADELLVCEELPAHKLLISELAAKVPAAGNALHYAQIVLLNAQLRAKLEGAQLIQQGVHERLDEELSARLIREGLQLAASDYTIDAEPTSGEEILDELFEHFDSDQEGEVFELPWSELNECVLGGYRRKQMSVLAGWTNMGKSWVLDQMMAGFEGQGLKVAIFATEMSREERAARWLTSQTAVPLEKILRNILDADDHRRLAKARAEANGKLPFDYFEAFGWSADRICERIIWGGYDVVAIDPVTEIPGFEKPEVASAASRRFAEVAGRANCHVIAVSHLNRKRLGDPKGVKPPPVLADLKGSGALETNAHAVLFLHRKQDAKTAYILPEGELSFAKIRNGLPKKIGVVQSSRTHLFLHLAPEPVHEQEALEVGSMKPSHDTGDGREFPF
jgi:replicative DNA helicase